MRDITFVILRAQITEKNLKAIKNTKVKDNLERVDILHQVLMSILDSPLNKAERVQIYIHTKENVLIEVNPMTKIPRTINRFKGLMEQLLKKFKIKASTGETLLKVIKNPITEHLKPDAMKIELSLAGEKIEKEKIKKNLEKGYVFFVSAIASGEDGNCKYAEKLLKVSDYNLTAAKSCDRICNLFEEIYEIF